MLAEHRASLNAIAAALLDKETIMLDDMVAIIREVEQMNQEAEIPA